MPAAVRSPEPQNPVTQLLTLYAPIDSHSGGQASGEGNSGDLGLQVGGTPGPHHSKLPFYR